MDKPTNRIEFETMLLGRHLTRPRRGEGHLDASAYALLSRLCIDGPMSVGELSEAFILDTSTISRQSSAMLNSGLVERIPAGRGIVRPRLTTYVVYPLGYMVAWL